MSATRYVSVLGLGFGDCGKGLFVDALTRRWGAHTVVRFSGGAQAGHNVVCPPDSRRPGLHHTFSQFGAGTFVPGTRTILLDPMVVEPAALVTEAGVLSRKGVRDALARLMVDGRCRLTTPYHTAAGRLRELLRGKAAHGSCGVGVGETVRHSLEHSDQTLRYADLLPCKSAAEARRQADKLLATRATLLQEFEPLVKAGAHPDMQGELNVLRDASFAEHWLQISVAVARHCPPATADSIREALHEPGCVIFEGAQGILLDEGRGFHPHTTWSSVTTAAVEGAAARAGVFEPIEHHGALRTYLTRHGNGPMPTHDPSLDAFLPEPHNSSECRQGLFRRGHPDGVLLRYALESIGPLSGLLVSHLDVFQRGVSLKWCTRYESTSAEGQSTVVARLPTGAAGDLSHQSELTRLLFAARPRYAPEAVSTPRDFLGRLADLTPIPVLLQAYGNTNADVRGQTQSS